MAQALDRGRAAAERDGCGAQGDEGGTTLPCREGESDRGGGQRQERDGLGRAGPAVGEDAAAREPGGESEEGPAHGRGG